MGGVKIGCVTIYEGDCLEVLPQVSGVSGVLTDPPYGLTFMGKAWDKGVPGVPFWEAIGAACLPGAHLLAFGGTRTYHRQTCAIEDAGWTVRDCLMWVYGSGFPKSLDISKAIDKAAGAEREVVGSSKWVSRSSQSQPYHQGADGAQDDRHLTAPATPNAHLWQGYGTALKPALEPIVLAQKPRAGSFVDNVLTHGCGALNVDGCRIDAGERPAIDARANIEHSLFGAMGGSKAIGTTTEGRWPSNVLIDDSPEVVGCFPSSSSGSRAEGVRSSMGYHGASGDGGPSITGSCGSAARFYYCAKASRAEREAGCWDVPPVGRGIHNSHPTVKPISLMRYLLRLIIQPERNLILDPFAGSGTTGIACALAGVPCVLIEQDPHHVEIIKARIQWATDIRTRLGREPDLDLSPYQSKPEPTDENQGSLF